jgi:hypothetical protein
MLVNIEQLKKSEEKLNDLIKKNKELSSNLFDHTIKVSKELLIVKEIGLKFKELGKWMRDLNEKMIYKIIMLNKV